jgi:hypothetical protein
MVTVILDAATEKQLKHIVELMNIFMVKLQKDFKFYTYAITGFVATQRI